VVVISNETTMALLLALSLTACGASAPGNTGGTDVKPGPCGRGLVVLESDYQSTNASLVSFDGEVLSSSFASSATKLPGGGPLFLGDVVAPTMPQPGASVALLSRFPDHAIVWLDVATGDLAARLSLAQGFSSNPQDYVAIDAHKAYASRLDPNLAPGAEPFDGGSDMVIVDPTVPAIVGRIDLSSALSGELDGFYPRPNRIVIDDDRAIVLLSAYNLAFDASAASRLVLIDTATDAILATKVLDGMHGCTGLALAPGGGRVAVACSGTFQNDMSSTLAEAGLVVLARHGDALDEEARFSASDLGGAPLGFSAAFAGDDRVLFTTFGEDPTSGAARDDTAQVITWKTGDHEVLLRSNGQPFTLGEVRCASACGACFVTDASRDGGVVQRLRVEASGLTPDSATRADTVLGLPPRYLGAF
jgi:hypothetical protein